MMRKTFYFLTLILLINSCKEAKRTVHKIEFETAYEFSSEIEDKTAKDTVPWKYQISASDYAAKGDYKNALLQWDLAMGGRQRNFSASQIDSINSKYHKVKATDYIIEKAKDHQVVNQPIEGKKAIKEMFESEFNTARMTCIPEHIFEDGDWAILEWKDPMGLRGCGFFHITDGKIKFQRGYWDKLSFLRIHNLPIP